MLRALKNLEAKAMRPSPRPNALQPAKQASVSGKVAVQDSALMEPNVAEAPAVAVIPRAIEVVDQLHEVVTGELAVLSPAPAVSVVVESQGIGFTDFAFFGQKRSGTELEVTAPSISNPSDSLPASLERGDNGRLATPAISPGKAVGALSGGVSRGSSNRKVESLFRIKESSAAAPVKPTAQPRQGGKPRELERKAKQILSDPVRSQPLIDLVDRLIRDIEHSSSKVAAFVTLGDEGHSRLVVLQVAVLLAERLTGKVLLVDGDMARCRLSEGLESGQRSGLSELLSGEATGKDCFIPTATNGLSFLPAGKLRHYDVSTSGVVLEKTLQDLAADFGWVLVEVGQAGSLGAAALARQTDATYLVVELGAVETVAAQKALTELRTAGARVLGCIAT